MGRREDLEAIWRAGVDACRAEQVLQPHLPGPPRGRTIVLALGKAAVPMARVVEQGWDGPLAGLAVTRHGDETRLERIDAMTAAHPVPDDASVIAAQGLIRLAEQAGSDDLVLVLLSGGASALACLPGEGLFLEEKQLLTEKLLRSGASIGEVNAVRRHLSRFKGGRLARAATPARLLTLAISDVAGDAPEDLGSGPTAADPTSIADARAILRRYRIEPPDRGWSESMKQVAGDYRIVARNRDALDAAAAKAAALGYTPRIVEAEGEAREAGRDHAALARTLGPGSALISGGELVVTVTGKGRGGPNQEYALAAAVAVQGGGMSGLAADTDGIDGAGAAAGAWFDGDTIARSSRDARAALADSDSGGYFASLGDLFETGPTGTNVSDLRIILTG